MLVAGGVQAKGLSPFVYPSAPPFSSVAPPVFPGPGAMGIVNASALTSRNPLNDITLANSIPMDSTQDFGIQAAYAVSSKRFGFAAGYAGTVGSSTDHGYFGAFSMKFDKISFGLGTVKNPGQTGTPSVDLSVTIPMLENMAFAAVFRNLAASIQPVFGVGYQGLFTQVQVFVELPDFSSSADGYTVGASLTWGMGNWNVYSAYTQQTLTGESDYSVGLGRWLTKDIHMSLQYEGIQRATVGVELSLD